VGQDQSSLVVESWQAENPCYAENKKTNVL
jgi:hypothetical protein